MTDTAASTNATAYSVSELAFALKRTLEDAYGFVRLRGELSKVTHHSNGHVYLTVKDDRAAIDGVVWKSQVRALGVRPEQGLEVVITGKVTTYPAGSRYQIVIETMEAAGVGALLAQLERLKAKLAAEGLFEAARKQPIPAMPSVVGVITSPTGAVIRDILHRIRDRWPCRVIVWPVVVQGDAAAAQVTAAIQGFNAIQPGGPLPRPDVIIVARGGGSVEDLWAFNDETLARAVAAAEIPLISAVGHETDTTLIDFVSDRRAPTPTALISGMALAAAVRASVSSLKGHRSSTEPPPRATMMTSGRGTAPPGSAWLKPSMAAQTCPAAASPCTTTGQTMTRQGQRSRMRWRMSRITAPVGLVITPTTAGMDGSGCLRDASNRPSAASFCFSRSSWASRAPMPAGSMVSMISWYLDPIG